MGRLISQPSDNSFLFPDICDTWLIAVRNKFMSNKFVLGLLYGTLQSQFNGSIIYLPNYSL